MVHTTLRRRQVLAAGSAALIGGAAGCLGIIGSDNPFERPTVDAGWPIDVGVLAPLSGPFERFGHQMREAITVVEAQVMAAETDFWVEFTIGDTESDPDTAVDVAQGMLDDGIEAFLGPALDESCLAVLEEVLLPNEAAAATPIGVRGWDDIDTQDLFYSMAPTTGTISRALGRMIGVEGHQSVAIIHGDGTYGTDITERVTADLRGRGIEISPQIAIDEEADEIPVDDILHEAVESDPDGIVFVTNPGDGTQLLESYYENYDEILPYLLTDRLRDPELPLELDNDLAEAVVVGIEPAHTRGGFAGRVTDYEEGVIADVGDDLINTLLDRRGDVVDITAEDGLEPEQILQPFHAAFDTLFDHLPTNQTMQTYDAAVILMLAGFQVGEGSYSGDRIGAAIPRVGYSSAAVQYAGSFGHRDWWDGLGEIGAGAQNSYSGATGTMELVELTGLRENVRMDAVRFDSDADYGFEQVFPLGNM